MTHKLGFLLLWVPAAWPQSPLSLTEAVSMGLRQHPAIQASAANEKAAQMRIQEARSGFLPAVTYSESYISSNNSAFAFGSLLNQRQFAASNFDIARLNNPDFINNFQSQVMFDQTIYDASSTRSRVHSAELRSQIVTEDGRRAQMGVIANVAGAYFGAVLAKDRLAVAQEAVRSAEADLHRAETVRAAGMSTDADVLSVRVHLAAMNEQEIQAKYTLDVAAAALNDALGLPLEVQHDLSTPLVAVTLKNADQEALSGQASETRPEAREAALGVRAAEADSSAARSALLPKISVHGAFEADRQTFVTRGGANWLFSASLNWNLFSGFAAQSRRQEAEHLVDAARAQQKRTDSAVRLEVRRAYAGWKGAQERIGVAAAAVSMAGESLRITRNRYEAGLTTITELLRNETAYLETKTRHLEAVYQQRLAATALELAAGSLSGDSDALK